MMPKLDGIEVCRRLRADATLPFIPIFWSRPRPIRRTSSPALEAGGDEYLTKPVDQAALVARVKSMLRIKALHDTVQGLAEELAEWNRTLEQRVAEQVGQLERLGRLKRFFSPQLAELIVAGGADDPLKSHRREVTVVFLDLRGFTAFAETAEPEEVMGVLREYHGEMGRVILEHEGTLERFAGDGMMVFFNDPVPVPDPAERAVRMALAMRDRADGARDGVAQAWHRSRLRRRHRAGLRDDRRDRLRGTLGLRRHRHRHEPGRAPVRRGQGRADPRVVSRGGNPRGDDRAGRDGNAHAQGVRQADPHLQRGGAKEAGLLKSAGCAGLDHRPPTARSAGSIHERGWLTWPRRAP